MLRKSDLLLKSGCVNDAILEQNEMEGAVGEDGEGGSHILRK
jgi:hypothetical protein